MYWPFTVNKDSRAYSPVHTYTFALLVLSVATSLRAGYRSQTHCERCTTDLTMFPCFSASTFICTIAYTYTLPTTQFQDPVQILTAGEA